MRTGRPPKQPQADGRYVCTRCNVPKHSDEFYPSQNHSWCKPCLVAYMRPVQNENKRKRVNAARLRRMLLQHRIESAECGLQVWAMS